MSRCLHAVVAAVVLLVAGGTPQLHRSHTATECGYVYRGDGVTLAVGRPMTVYAVSADGVAVASAVVRDGAWCITYPAGALVVLELVGMDMTAERVGPGFVTYWTWYVESLGGDAVAQGEGGR